ncbi:MAG: class I SAM-dependent methyltransferase [Roseiflexaceae bacterium]|nr:class I SAM-dependent methyltransferase [Roseiflexaceae bacterium]
MSSIEPGLEATACLLCGGDLATPVLHGPDYFMHVAGQYALVRCGRCGLVYQNPRPALGQIGRYYPQHYGSYGSAQQGLKARRGLMAAVIRRGQTARSRLLDARVPPVAGRARRLLDIGCASGLFLETMQRLPGWQVEGVELDQATAQATSARLGVPVFAGPFEQAAFQCGSFDAITLWDVLEHLHEPLSSLRSIRRLLRPGGVLFVRVPDSASYVARLCGRFWSGYDLPRHMVAFTPHTLAQMLGAAGFSQVLARYPSGSYLAALHSLRFAMDAGLPPPVAASIHRTLLHPLARAAVWLPQQLADLALGGSNIEVMVA